MGPGLKERRSSMDEPYVGPQKRARQARPSRFSRFPVEEDELNRGVEAPRVDLSKLKVVSLRKYAKTFDLDISPTAPKDELTSAVIKHWNSQPPLGEAEVLVRFALAARRQHGCGGNPNIR